MQKKRKTNDGQGENNTRENSRGGKVTTRHTPIAWYSGRQTSAAYAYKHQVEQIMERGDNTK